MTSILWYRHGLRLHDNPALLEALADHETFVPMFIFDGETAGTKVVGYNRMRFLLESLEDINVQFKSAGGRLLMAKGDPVSIFTRLHRAVGIKKICFEQDCEPVWQERDDSVKKFCDSNGIIWKEFISHTLWDPRKIIQLCNGPPATLELFTSISNFLNQPDRPVPDPNLGLVKFLEIPEDLMADLSGFTSTPSPKDFGLEPESGERLNQWIGGETRALQGLRDRLKVEKDAFLRGVYLPNYSRPDLLGPPTSQSPALRFGCLSVRRFYWVIQDLYEEVLPNGAPVTSRICEQLIWRDYFYTMSVGNPAYDRIEGNEICLDVPWQKNDRHLEAWKEGRTGFPFIDAVMRQLKQEGWVHHVGRNAAAVFLTRGVLWISWEEGLKHFLQYLLDADWSVCAGNWMWVSSSAFEQSFDLPAMNCPVSYGRRLDPWGEYVRRYVPELRNFPNEYLYEPWKASLGVQEKCGILIGRDYPERIVDHEFCFARNREWMRHFREQIPKDVPHCAPSNPQEVCQFMWLPEQCLDKCLVKMSC